MRLDEAYANAAYIPGGNDYPGRWQIQAESFRNEAAQKGTARLDLPYGPNPRQRFDLFLPESDSRGLFVFIHGGYWLRFDKSSWSHLARGALARGWTVAMPSYPLCPEVGIPEITRSIENAITVAAGQVAGPIRVAGHSAGGHLTARMACDDLGPIWGERLERAVPISPLSDLAPLMETSMNADLHIDAQVALVESPVRHRPARSDVSVWVGGAERPAFIDQAQWLGEAWDVPVTIAPERHHFDVIDGLAEPDSPLCREIFG